MLERINHTCIAVNDLDRSVAFYRDVVGCEVGPKLEYRNSICIPLRAGGNTLELMKIVNPEGLNWQRPMEAGEVGTIHVCFDVDNIEDHARKVRDSEAQVISDIHNMTTGEHVVRMFYFRDPDGHALQFVQEVPK